MPTFSLISYATIRPTEGSLAGRSNTAPPISITVGAKGPLSPLFGVVETDSRARAGKVLHARLGCTCHMWAHSIVTLTREQAPPVELTRRLVDFETLFQKVYPPLHRYCVRLAGDGDLAAADFIVTPSGPLTLQDARVTTHQLSVSVPIR